ncbi:MAG TPA: M3 family metallopeptidase [Polyangiaceae bacterium]|nr:M3 family metallopeptidase [Polyangiaceae bacterium]
MNRTCLVLFATLFGLAACGPRQDAQAPEPPPPPPPEKTEAPAPPAPTPDDLLREWTGPHGGVPPWDKADDKLFQPAIDKASLSYLAEVDAIADSAEPPTFDNTLAALERAGKPLDRAATLFFVMTGNRNTPEIQKLTGVIRPKLSEVSDKVNFNEKLFARVKAVYDAREKSELNAEQKRLVVKTYDDFVRRGANLSAEKKKRMGEINQSLAKLFTDFGNRVQADEDTWVLLKQEDLAGLPDSLVQSYKAAAQERKLEGFAVVNTRSAVDPFLTFSENREQREKVWKAFVSRGDNGDKNDTNELIVEIVKLRAERAKLLGFKSHAHWRMSDTMAKEPARAEKLMLRVWPAAVARVKQEVRDMQTLANKLGHKITIEPWDYRFYMEKVRKERYDLDQNEFKNYFELENMIAASYYMADRLYGYAFKEITGTVPVFHPDVRVFHVTNKSDGSHVGFLYRDDFARQYKRSGAWQATYQDQQKLDKQVDAIVSNNNNFTKAGKGQPVLISLDDAETLFHEFGHALHALTNDTTYPSLGGTPRDFVEFPSQVHENWVLTREVLDKYALHYKTKAKMPQALIDKMRAASTFNQGFATVEYLSAAIVDMKLHTDPKGAVDPKKFEKQTLAAIGMPKQIVMRHRLPHFQHLFTSDSYSAGYYSYLWSDVMAADAWEAFEETKDPWHPDTAKKFKEVILATGDAIDRAEAYRQFRGRDPKVEALLKNRGFPTR